MNSKIDAAWDKMADSFYAFVGREDSHLTNIERPAFLQMMGEVKGLNLLEIGCGNGNLAFYFAQKGAEVTGLDVSKEMINLANQEKIGKNLPVEFFVQDGQDLSNFGDSSFDLVYASVVFHYFEDIQAALKEVYRVLKSGGRFVFSQIHPTCSAYTPTNKEELINYKMRYFTRGERFSIPPWLSDRADKFLIKTKHYTVEDYFSCLRKAGFIVNRIVEPEPVLKLKEIDEKAFLYSSNSPLYIIFEAVKFEQDYLRFFGTE